jgi:hypothetical protein
MKLKRSDRHFGRIDFEDFYGKECTLQESSLADEQAIWFGVNGKGKRMHLTIDQVRELLPFLQRFVTTGGIE